MADDFNNLRNYQKTSVQPSENIVDIKKTTNLKQKPRMRFVITKNKANSWIDDFTAQAELDVIERIYH